MHANPAGTASHETVHANAPTGAQPARGGEARARVAVLGATGLVGREMLRLLEERDFPCSELRLLGSGRSGSRRLTFRGEELEVETATPEVLAQVDLVLSSAGGSVSRELLPAAARAGAICIDNTSAFRLDEGVPLVVPEVNAHALEGLRLGRGGAIVANPNCSTIQLVAALAPLHRAARVRNVICSTYQSISGAGREAVERFKGATGALLAGEQPLAEQLAGTPAFDVLPDIGGVEEDGHTSEERKMMRELPKILEADVAVDVTCVRVPVFTGHAESVLVQTERPLDVEEARRLIAATDGLVLDAHNSYVTPRAIAGSFPVHVGRLRRSNSLPNGLSMWVVADNLLKGAALNAVQIAEVLLARAARA